MMKLLMCWVMFCCCVVSYKKINFLTNQDVNLAHIRINVSSCIICATLILIQYWFTRQNEIRKGNKFIIRNQINGFGSWKLMKHHDRLLLFVKNRSINVNVNILIVFCFGSFIFHNYHTYIRSSQSNGRGSCIMHHLFMIELYDSV